jgi:hypothetical protein
VTNPRMAQFDLLLAARNALRMCPVKVTMRHVKGHQDDHWDTIQDRWASLNVEVDDGAKEQWYRVSTQRHSQQRIHAEIWPLFIGGVKVCTKNRRGNQRREARGKILTYWEEKGRLGQGNRGNVDWDTIGVAMKAATRTRRQWVTKHGSGFCATGEMMQLWGKRATAKCP